MNQNLERAIQGYKAGDLTPNLVTDFWAEFLIDASHNATKAGNELPNIATLTYCPDSASTLRELARQGRFPGFIPNSLSQTADIPLLVPLFPEIKIFRAREVYGRNQDGVIIRNKSSQSGWYYTEFSLDAPFSNKTEEEQRERIHQAGRDGMTLNTYVISAAAYRLLGPEGYPFDAVITWTRLLESMAQFPGGEAPVRAFHDLKGELSLFKGSEDKYPGLGARSVGY